MTLTQLEYVLAVEKFRHFKKAAESCHVTQPTLSMQLQKLEEELEIIIFDRSKSPVLVTTEGVAFIKQARIVHREYVRLLDLAKSQEGSISGRFHLGVIPTLTPYIVPLFVDDFQKKYPDVELTIEEMKTEDIVLALSKDEIDGGLLVTPLNEDGLIERVLYYENFHIFLNPNHKLLKKKKIKETDLDPAEVWLLNEGHCFRSQVLKVCGLKKNRRQSLFESGSLETLRNMVMKTSGYTIIPEMSLDGLPPVQKKLTREFCRPIPTREVSLVYGRSFHKEKIVEAIEESIVSSLPKGINSLKSKDLQVVDIE
jgi:LysR family hydrogen peroxide-inducible transcriptional activator